MPHPIRLLSNYCSAQLANFQFLLKKKKPLELNREIACIRITCFPKQAEKAPTIQSRQSSLCSRYLFSQVGQGIVLPSASVKWTLAGRKKPRLFSRGFVFALLIFPGSHPPSIVSVHELNFCVRDGNRWTLMTINTNSYGWGSTHLLYIKSFPASNILGDPYRIRTDVNGVRGRCLNHLTNGPLVHLQGLEPGTH